MGRCQSLGTLKSSFWYAPHLSGASIPCFHTLSFLRAHHKEWLQSDGCQMAGILFLVSSRLPSSLLAVAASTPVSLTSFVYWHSEQHSVYHYGPLTTLPVGWRSLTHDTASSNLSPFSLVAYRVSSSLITLSWCPAAKSISAHLSVVS